jgi:hypothetical protein
MAAVGAAREERDAVRDELARARELLRSKRSEALPYSAGEAKQREYDLEDEKALSEAEMRLEIARVKGELRSEAEARLRAARDGAAERERVLEEKVGGLLRENVDARRSGRGGRGG